MKFDHITSSIFFEDFYLAKNNIEQNLIMISNSNLVSFKNTNFIQTNFLNNNFSIYFNKTGGCVELNNVCGIYFENVNFLENFSQKRAFGIIIFNNFPLPNNFDVFFFFFIFFLKT